LLVYVRTANKRFYFSRLIPQTRNKSFFSVHKKILLQSKFF
jgi:hypothetical protein